MTSYEGICIRCRERKELPTGAMCSPCYAKNEEEGFPPASDGIYTPKTTAPEDPPRDDDADDEVTHG